MNYSKLIRMKFKELVFFTSYSMHRARQIAHVATRNRSGNPTEPEFVAAICDSMPLLQRFWRAVLYPMMKVEIAAEFCHNSPKVTWKGIQQSGRKSVELGDLLICHFHMIGSHISGANAIIFQAKATNGNSYRIGKKERAQLQLYQTLPAFRYGSPKALKGEHRRILASNDYPLAYMLIPRKYPDYIPNFYAIPNMRLSGSLPIEFALPKLLMGDLGRSFLPQNRPANDDWSRVIDDLLAVVFPLTYNLSAQNKKGYRRGVGRIPSFAYIVQDDGNFADPNGVRRFFTALHIDGIFRDVIGLEDEGISAVVVKTTESEREREKE